jgi:acyl carrier protein
VTTEEKVKRIIADQLMVNEEDVTPKAHLADDLGADSLDLIELVMAVEEEFYIEISDEDAENVRTVKDILDYVAAKVK